MSESEIPTLSTEIIGYRVWKAADETLRSIYIDYYWQPGVNEAMCLNPDGTLALPDEHHAPVPACACGLYALHCPNSEWGGIEGMICGYGRIEAHVNGFRAEHAKIVALAKQNGTRRERRMLKRIASRYEVPLVDRQELELVGKEFGDFVPDELRPSMADLVQAGGVILPLGGGGGGVVGVNGGAGGGQVYVIAPGSYFPIPGKANGV